MDTVGYAWQRLLHRWEHNFHFILGTHCGPCFGIPFGITSQGPRASEVPTTGISNRYIMILWGRNGCGAKKRLQALKFKFDIQSLEDENHIVSTI